MLAPRTYSPYGFVPLARLLCCSPALLTVPSYADESVAPYVPTVEEDVELMLDVGAVDAADYVIDLGSGDGRIVIAAARRGARGHGIELDPALVQLARQHALRAQVTDQVAFLEGNIFDADITAASVVTLYLFPEANIALRPKLLAELRPGTRVLSNSFTMGDWEPDTHDLSARSSGGILLWIIPADVHGTWHLALDDSNTPYLFELTQRYQRIELAAFAPLAAPEANSERWRPRSAELHGDRLSFTVAAEDRTLAFSGRIEADTMHGIVQVRLGMDTLVTNWRAVRR